MVCMGEISVVDNTRELYEKDAQNRYERIRNKGFSKVYYNHLLRQSVIAQCLSEVQQGCVAWDIGCGTGVWCEYLSQRCNKVVGLDFSGRSIAIARKSARRQKIMNIEYHVRDVRNIVESNCADIVLCISVLQHIDRQTEFIGKLSRMLHIDGKLVLLVQNRQCIYNRGLRTSKFAVNKYVSYKEIQAMLDSHGLEVMRYEYLWHFLLDFIFYGYTKFDCSGMRQLAKRLLSWITRFDRNPRHYRELILLCKKRQKL